MDFAIWAYPWDLRDVGVERALTQLESIGINELTLAANYHAVHSYAPTNPDRRSFFSQASAYFQPADTYGELAPIPAEQMGNDDWVAEIDEAAQDSNLSVNAWVVGCHNSRLGLKHPDVTITSPHGDSLAFGLCPSRPSVQEYLMAPFVFG